MRVTKRGSGYRETTSDGENFWHDDNVLQMHVARRESILMAQPHANETEWVETNSWIVAAHEIRIQRCLVCVCAWGEGECDVHVFWIEF